MSVPVIWIPLEDDTGICPGSGSGVSAPNFVFDPSVWYTSVSFGTVATIPPGSVMGVPAARVKLVPSETRVAETLAVSVIRVLPAMTARGSGLFGGFGCGIYNVSESSSSGRPPSFSLSINDNFMLATNARLLAT